MYREGDVLGRFVVESYVAAGGMGTVYRAKDEAGQRVAVKVLEARGARFSLLPGAVEDQRFAREVRLLSQLEHPGIVRYVGHGTTTTGDAYLAMEWLEGRALDARLRDGPLSAKEAMLLARRAAEALATVHAAGIVHRDLKPSNLFLPGDSIDRLRLIDFGIAHLERTESLAGDLIGTFAYMSPEQARGVVDLDSRSDVFALGAVLVKAITGKNAFEAEHVIGMLGKIQAEDPPHLSWDRPDVPIAFGDLVARMLAKSPDDRPRDGAAIVRALEPQAPESSRASQIGDRSRQVVSVIAIEAAGDLEAIRDAARPFSAEIIPIGRDAVLAVLVGRQNARDQAVQAARCALAIRKVVSSKLSMCTGFAEIARGSRVGAAIDSAAALLQTAEPKRVRVDDVTAGLLATDFDVVDGVLVGPASRQRTAREILGKATPFVGRDREIRELAEAIDGAIRRRTSTAIVVTGEAGAGKTRLQAELVKKVTRPDLGIAFARGDPLSAGAAFSIIAQVLRGMLGVWGKTPEVRRACIRARVSEHHEGAQADRVAEMIGELVGVPFPEDSSQGLRTARKDPAVMQDSMRASLAAFVSAECAAQPWLFVLEDAHWGDLPSMKLVDAALGSAKPLVVLALARPTIAEVFPDLWKARTVRTFALPPLDGAACEELARAVLGANVDVGAIATRSGGNAFFLEELVRAAGSGAELPETVVAMAASRVDALEPDAQRVLRAASVFGEAFTEEGVTELVGSPSLERIRALGKRDWFVSLPDGELGFRHDLLRQAAYDTLTTRDRAIAHALAAKHLERRGETRPLVLAEHWERGGKPDRAAAHFAAAARQAIDGNDFERAIECTTRGMNGAPPALEGVLLLLRAEAHRWNNDTESGAAAAIEAAKRFEPGTARWFDAVAEIVWSSGYSGVYDRVAEWADIAAATPHASGADGAKLVCLARSGTHLIHGDRVEHAQRIRAHVDAIAAAHGLADPIVRAWVHLLRAWLAYYEADWDRYLAGQRSVAAAFEDAGDLRNACRESVNYGHALMEIGAYEEAIVVMTEARSHAERAQLDAVVAQASQNIGYSLGQMGRTREALAELERGQSVSTTNLRHVIGLALYVSIVARRAGDWTRAEKEARSVLEKSMSIPTLRAQTHAAVAAALLGQGRAAEAKSYADEAERVLAKVGSVEELDALLRLIIAETRLANGDRDGARAMLEDALVRLMARIIPDARRAAFFAIPEHARIAQLFSSLT